MSMRMVQSARIPSISLAAFTQHASQRSGLCRIRSFVRTLQTLRMPKTRASNPSEHDGHKQECPGEHHKNYTDKPADTTAVLPIDWKLQIHVKKPNDDIRPAEGARDHTKRGPPTANTTRVAARQLRDPQSYAVCHAAFGAQSNRVGPYLHLHPVPT